MDVRSAQPHTVHSPGFSRVHKLKPLVERGDLADAAAHFLQEDPEVHCVPDSPSSAQPQTARAVVATTSSFCCWISVETRLPSIVEAKPHCGESASRPRGTILAAPSIRSGSSAIVPSRGFLVVTRPTPPPR